MFKNFFKIVLVLILMPSSVLYADHTILKVTKSITDNNQFPQNKIDVIKNDEENEEFEIAKQHEKEFNYRNWIRAMEQKEKMPSYIKKDINYDPGLNSILEISSKSNGAFFPTNQKKSSKDVIVHSAKNPFPNSSFGFIGVFANVESIKSDKIDGTLVLKINPLRLGTVDRNSLKVFYWDKAAKKFIKTRYSGIGHDNGGNYVWAYVTKPGVYAIIGRNTDPRITSFIKIVDGVKRFSDRNVKGFSDRNIERYLRDLCDQIFCTGDMDSRYCDVCIDAVHGIGSSSDIEIGSGDIILPPTIPTWEAWGPVNFSGIIGQVIFDPLNHDKLYAAAKSGGIWKLDSVSRYPSVTWVPLTDSLPILDMNTIASAGNGKIYAGGEHGDIFRSDNDGHSWSSIQPIREAINKILVDPLNENHLYAATKKGLYESNDSAITWSPISFFGSKDITDILFDPSNPHILYTASMNGLWKYILNNMRLRLPIKPVKPAFINILDKNTTIGNSNTTFPSFDGGVIAVIQEKIALKFYNEDNTTGNETGHILLYDRSVGKWSDITPPGHNVDLCTYGGRKNSIAIDPNDSNIILAGGVHLLRTSDSGSAWSNSIPGPHSDTQNIIFDSDNGGRVYVATDGGIFKSEDHGQTWYTSGNDQWSLSNVAANIEAGTNLNLNLITSQPFSIGIQNNSILGTFDHWGNLGVRNSATMQWESAPAGGAWEYARIYTDPYIHNRFYSIKDRTSLIVNIFSSNQGFEKHPHLTNFKVYGSIYHGVNGPIAVANLGDKHTIMIVKMEKQNDNKWHYTLMVTDEGDKTPNKINNNNWVNQPSWLPAQECIGAGNCHDINTTENPIAQVVIAPSQPQKAYAISRNGDQLWVNNNILNRQGWTNIPPNPSLNTSITSNVCSNNGGVRQLVIDPMDDNKLYVLGSGDLPRCNFLATSSDGGTSWNVLNWNLLHHTLPDSKLHSIIISDDDPNIIYLGADTGVYISIDGGLSWQAFFPDSLPNVPIVQMHIENHFLYVVTYGRGIWRINLR